MDRTLLNCGVYTLANDAVIEWFQAFIRSFRRFNPDLPLTVIPYNKSVCRLEKLLDEYQFTLMQESECSQFDALEPMVMGLNRSAGMFRKWASFYGHYKDFIFLDADIVVLSPLATILEAFSSAPYDLIYFDSSIDMAYAPEWIMEMKAKYNSAGFNAGAFVSRRAVVTDGQLKEMSLKASSEKNKFFTAFDVGDQPFMNYVFDVLRQRMACIDQICPDYSAFGTARQMIAYDWRSDVARNSKGKLMLFIHWPGCTYPAMVKEQIFLRHRTWGFSVSVRILYYTKFYLFRYWICLVKSVKRWSSVAIKLLSSKSWMKYYICKFMGIKVKAPNGMN